MTAQVSDWICICTSGAAIDGRPIEQDMLLQAAEHYDASFYTALLWPWHGEDFIERERWVANYGIVRELKTERVDGEVKLYAKISPNQYLIEANRYSQKLFTSCEFWPDFQGKGYFYLQGLAVTDIPASTGTDMLQFSAKSREKGLQNGGLMEFSLGKLSPVKEKEPSLFDRILSGMSSKKYTPEPKNEPLEEPENMDELKELLQRIEDAIKNMASAAKGNTTDDAGEAAEEVREAAEEIVIVAEQLAELADEVSENPEDELVKEEFTALRATFNEKLAAFVGDDLKFSSRRRRAMKAFSVARQQPAQAKPEGNTVLEGKVDQLIETLSALAGKTVTTVPGKKSGSSDAKRSVL